MPFVPWQLAQAAARLRARLGSAPCARADRAKAAPEASVAARTLRIMSAPRGFFFWYFECPSGPADCQGVRRKKQRPLEATFCSRSQGTLMLPEPPPALFLRQT